LWLFQSTRSKNPHKMRLKRNFSTERWYKIGHTAGKFQ
jgi:hypothetical protein